MSGCGGGAGCGHRGHQLPQQTHLHQLQHLRPRLQLPLGGGPRPRPRQGAGGQVLSSVLLSARDQECDDHQGCRGPHHLPPLCTLQLHDLPDIC